MRQQYDTYPLQKKSRAFIAILDAVVEEYKAAGYILTARQLYYQLVSRDILPNTEKSYKYACRMINIGKMCGIIDWDALEDRTRSFERRSHWRTPGEILDSSAESFHMDLWETQDCRVVILIEKEALYGVFSPVCHEYDVPMLCARGYPSGSVLREFAVYTMIPNRDQRYIFLHFGDHDPSGIDMSRDLHERLSLFSERKVAVEFHRIALNMDQIEEWGPPPNPAKVTDSRFKAYADQFGDSSWELDALDPRTLHELAEEHVKQFIDFDRWNETHAEIKKGREQLAFAHKLLF